MRFARLYAHALTASLWTGRSDFFFLIILLLLFFYRLSFSKQASNDLLTPYAFIPFLFRLSLNDLLRRMLFLERRCKITAFSWIMRSAVLERSPDEGIS